MNQAKTDAVVEYIKEGGSLELDAVAAALSLSPKSVKSIANYLGEATTQLGLPVDLAVGGVNPFAEEIDDEEEEMDEPPEEEQEPEPEPEPVVVKPKTDGSKPYRFFLQQDNGTSVELEQVNRGGKVVTFREKPITDVVKLMLGGVIVEVDLVELRLLPAKEVCVFGERSNDALLKLALAAKP